MGTARSVTAEPPGPGGSSSRFADFVRQNTPSLFATARLLTGNRDAAEDLLQEVLTRLLPRWDRVIAADNPLAYVRRAVVNAFISSTRRAANGEVVADSDTLAALMSGTHEIGDHADSVATAVTIAPLLAGLGSRQRAALVLRYFHGSTDAEIAESLGCRRGTARSLISRGLEILRRDLGSERADSAPRTDPTNARGADR